MKTEGSIKTEHAGAKNGGGHWGPRAEAKQISRQRRRAADKRAEAEVVTIFPPPDAA